MREVGGSIPPVPHLFCATALAPRARPPACSPQSAPAALTDRSASGAGGTALLQAASCTAAAGAQLGGRPEQQGALLLHLPLQGCTCERSVCAGAAAPSRRRAVSRACAAIYLRRVGGMLGWSTRRIQLVIITEPHRCAPAPESTAASVAGCAALHTSHPISARAVRAAGAEWGCMPGCARGASAVAQNRWGTGGIEPPTSRMQDDQTTLSENHTTRPSSRVRVAVRLPVPYNSRGCRTQPMLPSAQPEAPQRATAPALQARARARTHTP
jgi:hypothetical protein